MGKARNTVNIAVTSCIVWGFMGLWHNMAVSLTFEPNGTSQMFLHIGRLTSLFLFIFIPSFFERNNTRIGYAGNIILASATVIFCLHRPSLASLGLFLGGVAYMFILTSTLITYGHRLKTKEIIWTIALSLMLRQMLSFAFQPYSDNWHICIIILFVILATIFAGQFILNKLSRKTRSLPKRTHTSSVSTFVMALGLMANITLFIVAAADSYTAGEYAGNPTISIPSTPLSTAIGILALLLSTEIAISNNLKYPLVQRYLPSFAILAAALPIAIFKNWFVSNDFAQIFLTGLLNGIRYFGLVLSYNLAYSSMKQRGSYAYRNLAIVLLPYDILMSLFVRFFVNGLPTNFLIAILIIGYCIVSIVSVILPSRAMGHRAANRSQQTVLSAETLLLDGESDEKDVSTCIQLNSAVEERCRYLSSRFRLTDRERAVLVLLCQGRNRSAVCDRLNISESTAKTHFSHIYEKMHVKSHQELLTIAFGDSLHCNGTHSNNPPSSSF